MSVVPPMAWTDAHFMRWWRIARAVVFGWYAAFAVWFVVVLPVLPIAAVVCLAGCLIVGVAVEPGAPWWAGHAGLADITPAQRRTQIRGSIRDFVALLVVFVVVLTARVWFSPA
jgi:hypothetical protein